MLPVFRKTKQCFCNVCRNQVVSLTLVVADSQREITSSHLGYNHEMAKFRQLRNSEAFALGLILVCCCLPVSAKYCYQCDSTLDHNCQENWDDSLSTNQEKYQPCQLWDAKFCIKVTGLWGGVVGTHRFCSSRDMGDQCQDIWFPDHDRMYRACVYTCSGDGCNSANRLSTLGAFVVPLVWFVMYMWRSL